MNAELLRQIAFNIITGFLLTLGIVPSEGEDVLEQMDFGPHRVFVQQARVPDNMADSIDPDDVFAQLVAHLDLHNVLPAAVPFYPYKVDVYVCPCGCGSFLYIGIYHDA